MTRRARDGLGKRWVYAVAPSNGIGHAAKVLLLFLAATDRVSERGYLTFNRDAVAAEMGIGP